MHPLLNEKTKTMSYKFYFVALLTLLTSPSLLAQTDHAWIGTGKVRVRITPTGIHPDAEGGFLLESGIPGQWVSRDGRRGCEKLVKN